MRNLALVAAALLPLVSGCVSSSSEPPVGSATVYWSFESSDGLFAGNWTQSNSGCAVAAVTEVRVAITTSGGALVESLLHPCEASNGVPGAAVPSLTEGGYHVVATAYRGADPVFTDSANFSVAAGMDTPVQLTLGVTASQPLSIFYKQAGIYTCAGVNTANGIYYSISDGGVLVTAGHQDCVSNYELYLPLADAVGTTYTVDFLQMLNGGTSIYEKCHVAVLHNGFPVVINLGLSPDPSCP
jgi:hypothetical protein